MTGFILKPLVSLEHKKGRVCPSARPCMQGDGGGPYPLLFPVGVGYEVGHFGSGFGGYVGAGR